MKNLVLNSLQGFKTDGRLLPYPFSERGVHFFFSLCFPFQSTLSVRGQEGERMTEVVTWSSLLQFVDTLIGIITLVLAIVNFVQNNNKKK